MKHDKIIAPSIPSRGLYYLYSPLFLLLFTLTSLSELSHARQEYVEPGTVRMSNTLSLEGVFNRLRPGWHEEGASLNRTNKRFVQRGNNEQPWKSEWGQRLLSEIATRTSPDVFGRALFEIQGEYADRLWRPINTNHRASIENDDVIIRQAEGRIDKDNWYLHGFSGVERPDWYGKGDFFRLYPPAYPNRDYLGSSSYFGVYPQNWREDQFRNISGDEVARGGELGVNVAGMDGTVAYGDELAWGIRESFYGRFRVPAGVSKFTFVYKDEDAPTNIFDEDDRNQAYALSWSMPFESGHQIDLGVLYNPYRTGEQYQYVRDVPAGTGLLGSSKNILTRTARKDDAFAYKGRFEHYLVLFNKLWIWSVELFHAEVLAGNKQKAEANINTTFWEIFKADFHYAYQRPVEEAIPFLFEGTPTNITSVAASPRGPESPFNVDWTNREAVFVVSTFQIDPTPGSSFFIFDPKAVALWNVNPEEESDLVFAVQHRMSDYLDTTDRQSYYDEKGAIVWEGAAHTGAWPTDHPLHEVRFLGQGNMGKWKWVLGLAGGQAPAQLGLAYSNDSSVEKPITEYFSLEGRFDRWPFGFWWHYGSGLWGPEENIHPNFGLSYDRLYGLGVSYNITKNTTWDINYLAARQDDDLFVASDLGSFDEIRTIFSHRFGFLFHFKRPLRRGFQAR